MQEALSYVRDRMGLTNIKIMIPFVRTLAEAEGVIRLLGEHGLKQGVNDLQVIMMCELPSNAVIADAFLDYFDGFSIGSNDATQLTLGLDRDSALVAAGFDERDPAVKFMLSAAIQACKARGKYVGICGQGPATTPTSPMVARTAHRLHVAEPRHRCRHLAPPRPAGEQSAGHGRPAGITGGAAMRRRPLGVGRPDVPGRASGGVLDG